MSEKNLLIICNNFPNQDNSFVGGIFIKEQIKYLKNYFNNVYVISPVAYGMELLRGINHFDYRYDNVKVFFPKYINNPLFWYYGKAIWIDLETRTILSLIKKENLQFNLIHAHYTWPSGAVATNIKKILGVPVVITEHTHQTLYHALDKKDKYYSNTWHDCDSIIRVNKKDVPLILNSGIDLSKVHSIANGFDPKKYYPIEKEKARQLLGLPTELKLILTISRLYSEKGQRYLISAIKDIVRVRDDVICYIGGTGPLKQDLEDQISSLNLQKYVKLVGFIPDNQMSLWINAADIFILPSLGEGNPTIMFECLGCGKPFVGTKVGGIPEIITSDRYGLLVDPANSDDLAEKISIALDKEWDQNAIRVYAERYTWEKIASEIMDVYKQVLG